jgi:hypothetical protein
MEQSFKVYRLEHEHTLSRHNSNVKVGCYVHFDSDLVKVQWYLDMCEKHRHPQTHPSIWEDGLCRHSDLFCAFDSIERLKDWFDGYLVNLIDWGFVVREYTVNTPYLEGKSGRQVMFDANTVTESKIILEECLVD